MSAANGGGVNRRRAGLLACILILIAACVPAQTPAHLTSMPGAWVSVADDTVTTALFRVRYPPGWRVITSSAEAPPAVTFVSPDNCALILVSSAPAETPVSPSCDKATQTIARDMPLGESTITLAGSAPVESWDVFAAQVDQVAESLRPAE